MHILIEFIIVSFHEDKPCKMQIDVEGSKVVYFVCCIYIFIVVYSYAAITVLIYN